LRIARQAAFLVFAATPAVAEIVASGFKTSSRRCHRIWARFVDRHFGGTDCIHVNTRLLEGGRIVSFLGNMELREKLTDAWTNAVTMN
jgi:hypothetical protein